MGDVAEKIIAKLRSGMMPPPGSNRARGDTLRCPHRNRSRLSSIPRRPRIPIRGAAPSSGLNRAEYTAAIRELLGLEIDAGGVSAARYEERQLRQHRRCASAVADAARCLSARGERHQLARGRQSASDRQLGDVQRAAHRVADVNTSKARRSERAAASRSCTRSPPTATYVFKVVFFHETTGAFAGGNARGEKIEISIDGERVALLDVDRFMTPAIRTASRWRPSRTHLGGPASRVGGVHSAGLPGRRAGSRSRRSSGRSNSTSNATAYGFSLLPHLRDLVIPGPYKATGVSDSPVRRRIFTCSPEQCRAKRGRVRESIVSRLGTRGVPPPAHRAKMCKALMSLYDGAAKQTAGSSRPACARRSRRSSPAPTSSSASSVRRTREARESLSRQRHRSRVAPLVLPLGRRRRITSSCRSRAQDKLARRSCARAPGAAHARRSARGSVSPRDSPRSGCACRTSTRCSPMFGSIPTSTSSCARRCGARRSCSSSICARRPQRARPVHGGLHVRQRAAGDALRHSERRRQRVPARHAEPIHQRRGVLGHASILTLTSHATRTSAVDRGKWVMEVFLHSPPPPPPPGVPDLEATPGAHEGTSADRARAHGAAPQESDVRVVPST